MSKIKTISFCDSFIDELVLHIKNNFIDKGRDLSRMAVVFGGKRPSLFVKRELARRIKSAFRPPRFFTIDEFVEYTLRKKTGFRTAGDLDECYLMYHLAKEHSPAILKGRESFAQFLPWTREILKLIDHLDLENVTEEKLKALKANAQIGFDVPSDINKLLESIFILREKYHSVQDKKGAYSRGFQYLKASQCINDVSFDEFEEILLCNFFYLHQTEEKIFKSLYHKGKASFIFQGDQRKWPVLERMAKKLDCSIFENEEAPDETHFNLKLHKGFDVHSQMCLVRKILKSVGSLDKTVVVLPDPEHIVSLISEISAEADNFNISMGYPLKRSSLYCLYDFIFQSQLSRKGFRYYARDYLRVLQHPFIKNLKLHEDPSVMRILAHKIEEILTGKEKTGISGSLFLDLQEIEGSADIYSSAQEMLKRLSIEVSSDELKALLGKIHGIFFRQWEKICHFESFASVLGDTLDILLEKSFMEDYPLNANIASRMYEIKDELRHASFCSELFSVEEIFKIFDSKISAEMVSFAGSPLKGLQILGLFETRSLNFENVIIVDVNEGVLPKLNIYEPLIPREVMLGLNLDRLELEEEIQRYQFMRLISSAKNVHLVYQQSRDKERSRFVEELVWEHQKKTASIESLPVEDAKFQIKIKASRKIIEKTPQMIDVLKKHTFSSSSVNMYLRNPIDFYYNYVLGLREKEDLLDEPEARHIGTFIHELLEEAFKPFINRQPVLDKAFAAHFFAQFERKFAQTFERSMKSDAFLLKSVMYERLTRFLEYEHNAPERRVKQVLFLENRFEGNISLRNHTIKFNYIVDRIDEMLDGTIMIIDYKTGSMDQMPKKVDVIKKIELSRETILENIRSFQIPLYFYYLQDQFKGRDVNAALYKLQALEYKTFLDEDNKGRLNEIRETFDNALNYIMDEILDVNVPFLEPLE